MRWRVGGFGLLVLLSVAGCSQHLLDGESDLALINDSTCEITLWVDGREAFSVKPGAERVLNNLGPGRHVLEAVNAHGKVVERHVLELAPGEDYYWTVSAS